MPGSRHAGSRVRAAVRPVPGHRGGGRGLALDGLDDHDAAAVVAGLCADLVAKDPGAAVRARSRTTLDDPADLHDPVGVAAAYQFSATILQL